MFKKTKTVFTGFKCLLKKCENLRTYEEAINERRKLPPQIVISGTNKSKEDEKAENKTIEYEYCSWEDTTDFKLEKTSPYLKCEFILEVNFDKEALDDLEKLKEDLENNSVTNSCSDFQPKETCFLVPPNKALTKFYIFLWFILYITGYVDILDYFIYFEEEKILVVVKKVVSNTNQYRASYKQIDEKLSIYKMNVEEDKNESYNNIELKDQPLL